MWLDVAQNKEESQASMNVTYSLNKIKTQFEVKELPDGYLFYPNGKLIIQALSVLSEYFDDLK